MHSDELLQTEQVAMSGIATRTKLRVKAAVNSTNEYE